jgi:hypothetical protein
MAFSDLSTERVDIFDFAKGPALNLIGGVNELALHMTLGDRL